MFDFFNQDVVGNSYLFRKSTYNQESIVATRLRGVGGQGGEDHTDYAALAQKQPRQQAQKAASKAQSQKSSGGIHKVQRGETLYAIARKHGTTVDAICRLNRITTKTILKPGQILKYN